MGGYDGMNKIYEDLQKIKSKLIESVTYNKSENMIVVTHRNGGEIVINLKDKIYRALADYPALLSTSFLNLIVSRLPNDFMSDSEYLLKKVTNGKEYTNVFRAPYVEVYMTTMSYSDKLYSKIKIDLWGDHGRTSSRNTLQFNCDLVTRKIEVKYADMLSRVLRRTEQREILIELAKNLESLGFDMETDDEINLYDYLIWEDMNDDGELI